MKKYNRSWGNTALAWLIVASLVAPTAALAWTPTGDKPIDNGDEPGQPGMEAVGDPDDGAGGRPQPIIQDDSIPMLLLRHYLRVNVDGRILLRLEALAHQFRAARAGTR